MTDKIDNNEKTFFETIGDSLKDLMKNITDGLNSILIKLGLKKEQELKKLNNFTEGELKNLRDNIIKVDGSLDKKEEKLINEIDIFKKHYDWLTEKFGKDFAKKEMVSFIEVELLNRIKDLELTKSEQNNIEEKIKKQKDSLNDKKLINITKEILNGSYNYTIGEIIEAYNKIKENNEEPTKNKIIEKLSSSEVEVNEDETENDEE